MATVLRGNEEVEVLVDELMVEDIVIVKPGEKVPVMVWLLRVKATLTSRCSQESLFQCA